MDNRVERKLNQLKQWRELYPAWYIHQHFVIWNYDGEAEAILDSLDTLTRTPHPVSTPSEQLQAELEPLPETYYPPKKKLEDALKEGAPLLGTYPGKFHVG